MGGISKTRSRLFRQNGFKTIASFSGSIDREVTIGAPWQLVPIDPTISHRVTIERRAEQPDDARAVCTCGLDRGWQSLFASEIDADLHERQVEALHACSPPLSTL